MNERITHVRDVALDILKPARKDLERGLELHAQSLVFDAYGFAPCGSSKVDGMIGALESGASPEELRDLQSKQAMTGYVTCAPDRAEIEEAWRAAGVTCIFQNAGEEGQDPLRMLRRLAHFTYVTDFLRDFLFKAVRPADIEAARREGRRCLYLTTNGVPLAQRWESVPTELGFIELFFHLGVRMMHVTYNRRNMLGDGCAETADGGLSDLGRAAIAEMNRVGIIVDVAHSGWRTSLEAAKSSAKPMVASHSGSAALQAHYRCKPDEVIRAIADTGGYVGVCCIPRFLGRSGDIAAFLDHVEDIARRFGPAHVAIGTDTAYVLQRSPADAEKLANARFPKRPIFESYWRPEPDGKAIDSAKPGREAQASSLAWTNWPLFTVGLVQRGFSDEAIRQIIGGNVLRVAQAALG